MNDLNLFLLRLSFRQLQTSLYAAFESQTMSIPDSGRVAQVIDGVGTIPGNDPSSNRYNL